MTATTESPRAAAEPGTTVALAPVRPWPSSSAWSRVLLTGAGALYAYDQQYDGRILPGVRVGIGRPVRPHARRRAVERSPTTYGVAVGEGGSLLSGVETAQVITYAEIGRATGRRCARRRGAWRSDAAGSPLDRAVADARTALRGVALDPSVDLRPGRRSPSASTAIAESLRIEPGRLDRRPSTTSCASTSCRGTSAGTPTRRPRSERLDRPSPELDAPARDQARPRRPRPSSPT